MKEQEIRSLIVDDEQQTRGVLSYIIQNSDLPVTDIFESTFRQRDIKYLKKQPNRHNNL